ncbi:MAG TPA: HAMP domain-containing sensor histidine kinase [Candidatus Acidoferrum sp.]|nr:HAMP domain-containing sensor histidine kinase [Candidatus Acidoferrum sp.]
MSVFADRNRIYLVLIYFSMSFFYIAVVLSDQQDPIPILGYMMGLIVLVVATHDTLLRIINQATGFSGGMSELSYFSAFIELSRKIHNLLEADDVLELVNATLKERVHLVQTLFFLSPDLPTQTRPVGHAGQQGALYGWPEAGPVAFPLADLDREARRRQKPVSLAEAPAALRAIFDVSNTSLMVPVIQDGNLLAVLLLGRTDNDKPYSDFEIQMFSFLANQLTIILDRIRVYAKIIHKTAMDHAEKLQVMQSLSANIAHEMRTPLSGIRASISGIEEYLPQLLECQRWCEQHAKGQFLPIRENHLNVLVNTPRRIKLMIDQANTVIDMLLMNLRENALDRKQFNIISATNIIEQAVDRYPFKTGQREKLHLDLERDFSFLGIESLCIYIFFNLLKNAYYSLQGAQKGEITIALQQRGHEGVIRFRDTGLGIDSAIIDRIFEGFFTTKQEGTGAGLAFCKRTIESFNGSITCESVPREYAEFVITLPIYVAS